MRQQTWRVLTGLSALADRNTSVQLPKGGAQMDQWKDKETKPEPV
jgi:hypothetical protein